jgi:hypothetical protein
MPLHRQVFWVGRQWAVTGHGMQAVDQKQKSKFDIEIARLWDDDLADSLSSERWFNLADFNEGLAIARARYPEPPGRPKPRPKPAPPREAVSPLKEGAMVTPVKSASAAPSAKSRSKLRKPMPADPAQTDAAKFVMRVDGGCAKFTTMWRVRIHR